MILHYFQRLANYRKAEGYSCLKAEMQKYILKLSLEGYPEEILVPYTPKPAVPTNLTEQFPWINFS